jgi:Tol biopolymer transport system component
MQWNLATTVSILTLPEKVAPRSAEDSPAARIRRSASRMRTKSLAWTSSLLLVGCADFVSAPVEQIGPLIFVESTSDGGQQIGSLTTDGQRGAELGSRHARVISPRWSPNGGMIAYVGFKDDRIRDLWIVDVDEQGRPGEPRSVLRWDTAEQPPLLHWLPDESGLVWSEMTDTSVALRHLELESGEDTWHHQTGLWNIDVANDGRIVGRVMVDETDSALAVYDAAFEPLIETEIGLGEMPIWSPDASEVAFVLRDQPGIGVLDPDTGAWQRLTDAPDTDPRWSPDGTRLSIVRDHEQLVVRDRQTGAETVLLDADAKAHEWSRDGQHLALRGSESSLWLLGIGDASVLEVEDMHASVPNLDWGPP